MRTMTKLLAAVPIAAGLLLAPVAHADGWQGRGGGGGGWHGGGGNGGWHGGGGGWHGGGGGWHGGGGGWNNGGAVAGAVIGLGAAAVLGGELASQAYAPPVYYAPAPAYYPPTTYYAAP